MVTPEEAIEAVHEFGGEHPGYRALHAKGSMFHGTFTASPEAATLSRAVHLDGRTVPALVRFSNGAPEPDQADNKPGVRGMAVKLSLPDGSTTDISAQTARLFTSSTPEGFVEFLKAAKPSAAAGYRLAKWAAQNPEVFRGLRQNAVTIKIPASYATVEYHALHAFRFVDADGNSKYIRYHWIPEAGEQFLSLLTARSKDREFLTDERDRTRTRRRYRGFRSIAGHRRHRALRRSGLAFPQLCLLGIGACTQWGEPRAGSSVAV